jgi:hypothetical protein
MDPIGSVGRGWLMGASPRAGPRRRCRGRCASAREPPRPSPPTRPPRELAAPAPRDAPPARARSPPRALRRHVDRESASIAIYSPSEFGHFDSRRRFVRVLHAERHGALTAERDSLAFAHRSRRVVEGRQVPHASPRLRVHADRGVAARSRRRLTAAWARASVDHTRPVLAPVPPRPARGRPRERLASSGLATAVPGAPLMRNSSER